MEKNIEILQFLDGSLSPEAEAELLHRLSVSPERRDVLRSHIDQRVLFQRDREAIHVPYAAEQKLWTRLAEVMPIAPAATIAPATTAVISASRGFRWLSVASIGTLCVVIGLLSGFYLGRNAGNEIAASSPVEQTILTIEQPPVLQAAPEIAQHVNERSVLPRQRSEAPLASLPVLVDHATPIEAAPVVTTETVASPATAIMRAETPTSNVFEPRESHSLAELIRTTQQAEQSVYPMELSFAESFGIQFPMNATSRTTQPLITNSTITGMYQLYHGAIEVWVGANIGSVNLAKKVLTADPQPGGSVKLIDGITHQQATWVGPTAQVRHRFTEHLSGTVSTGISYSGELGMLFFGELGGRYDLTDQVGITLGLRSFHLPYDLSQEQAALEAKYKGIDNGGDYYGNQWSHNVEILTGMYFRF